MMFPRRVERQLLYRWALLGLVSLFFATFFVYQAYDNYRAIKAAESERLLHQARLIDLAISNELTAAANTLRDIRAMVPGWTSEPNGRERATEILKQMERSLLGIRTLLVLDAIGNVFATSHDEVPDANFRELDYFQYPFYTPDDDILFVLPPLVDSPNAYIMNLSIGVFDADRQLQGVVSARLNVEHLNLLLNSVRYHDSVRVLLSHGSGVLYAMQPGRKGTIGANQLVPGSFLSRHLERGMPETVLEGISVVNKDERIVAARTIIPPDLNVSHPLVVTVSHDPRVILSQWRKDTFRQALTLGLLMTATFVTFYFYQRAQKRLIMDRIDLLRESNKSKERLLAVFDNHQDGFVICDADDRVIAMNVAYKKINRLAKDAITLRLTFEDIIRLSAPMVADARNRIDEYVSQRLAEHRVAAAPIIRQIGDHWYMIRDVRTPGGETISVLTNITELKKAQDTLRRSERALAEKTERLLLLDKAKDRFLATMSHELRTPLNAILGFAQLLEREQNRLPLEKRREFVNDILTSGRHLLSLINDLLDMTQIEAGKRNLVFATMPAADAWKFPLKSISVQAAEKKLTLKTHIPETPIWLAADRRALYQCLLNVLGNAVKFTPPGGTVTCRTDVIDGRVLFGIEDTGIGIASEDLARLGRPFEQVGDPYQAETKGTGLGLAIASRLAEMMGGKLEIRSELGKGTRVTIGFPVEQALPVVARSASHR